MGVRLKTKKDLSLELDKLRLYNERENSTEYKSGFVNGVIKALEWAIEDIESPSKQLGCTNLDPIDLDLYEKDIRQG